MFIQLKEYKQKYKKLDNLKTRIGSNKKRKKEVLTNVSDIFNEFYYFYKNKHNKKRDTLSTENENLLDYKQLRLSDYVYLSEEEEEKEEKQNKETISVNKFNESTIKKGMNIKNMELFNKHFNYQTPSALLKVLYETNDTEKNNKLDSLINSGLKDLKEEIKNMSEA